MTSSADEDDGSLSCVVGRSGTQASSLPVNLRISQTGDFLASGGTGDKTFTKGTSLGSSVYVISFDDDDVDEPNGSATCTLLPGSGYTVGSPNSDTTTIVDDDPTIASLVATSDVTFTEQVATDTAAVTVRLSRRLYAGEQLAVPIDYVGAEGIDAHDESDRDYALSVSGNGATGANLSSDIFYVQFTGHDTDIVQEATVTLTPTNNGDADTDDGYIELGISAVTADWTDSSFTNVGGGGVRHATQRLVRLTYRDNDLTLTLSIPDDLAVEDDVDNEAQIRVALSRALVSGETVTVPLNFAGASRPADFNLVLGSNFTGVSLSGSTVTFTGPSVAAATMNVLAVSDSTDDDETVTVSLGTVTSTGVTVNRETTVNSQIRLLETAPYTPSPGPPLVIVDSIVPIGGSCTGRECEITEAPAGSDIIINVRLVRPALEKGVGFIPVAATRQIAVNAYLQPGVHAHQWLTPPTFAVGEKIKTWLLRMSPSTLVESDVRRMLMFSGPVGSWGEGNPPPFGVVTNDPYWITIKDGPDGNAGTIAPIVTIRHTYWQELDGGAAEGRPVHFEVSAPSPAQGRFPVYLKVEQTAGDCVAPANLRTHKVTFPPRVASVGFSVATVDDSTGEQDCTVKVSLARADGTVPGAGTTTQVLTAGRFGYIIDKTNDARLGGARTHRADATGTVRDDDSVARKVSFVTGSRQVRESTAGRVDLVVALDPAPSADLTLNYRLSGTATRGVDYTVPATVTVPSGATRAVIPVTVVDDSVEDSGEWVVVHLEESGGYRPFTPIRSGIRILNHDPVDGAPAVDPALIADVRAMAAQTQHGAAHVKRWRRVLVAFGVEDDPVLTPTTAAEAEANAKRYSSPLWPRVANALRVLEAAPVLDTPPPPLPEIAVTADASLGDRGRRCGVHPDGEPGPGGGPGRQRDGGGRRRLGRDRRQPHGDDPRVGQRHADPGDGGRRRGRAGRLGLRDGGGRQRLHGGLFRLRHGRRAGRRRSGDPGGGPGAGRGGARDGGADAARRGACEALAARAGGVRRGGVSGPDADHAGGGEGECAEVFEPAVAADRRGAGEA